MCGSLEYIAQEKPNCPEYKDGRKRRTDEDARPVLLLRCNAKVVIYMCMITGLKQIQYNGAVNSTDQSKKLAIGLYEQYHAYTIYYTIIIIYHNSNIVYIIS